MITGLIIAGNVILYLIWWAVCYRHLLKDDGITSYEEFKKSDTPKLITCLLGGWLAIVVYLPATIGFPFYLLAKKYKEFIIRLLFWEFPKKPEIKKIPEDLPIYGESSSYRNSPSIVRK